MDICTQYQGMRLCAGGSGVFRGCYSKETSDASETGTYTVKGAGIRAEIQGGLLVVWSEGLLYCCFETPVLCVLRVGGVYALAAGGKRK